MIAVLLKTVGFYVWLWAIVIVAGLALDSVFAGFNLDEYIDWVGGGVAFWTGMFYSNALRDEE